MKKVRTKSVSLFPEQWWQIEQIAQSLDIRRDDFLRGLVDFYVTSEKKPVPEKGWFSYVVSGRSTVSPSEDMYLYIVDWVNQHIEQLCGKSDTVEVLGAMSADGKYAYIIRSAFVEAVKDGGYSLEAVLSHLSKRGLIIRRGKNRTKAKRINGVPTECFCVVLPDKEDSELF